MGAFFDPLQLNIEEKKEPIPPPLLDAAFSGAAVIDFVKEEEE